SSSPPLPLSLSNCLRPARYSATKPPLPSHCRGPGSMTGGAEGRRPVPAVQAASVPIRTGTHPFQSRAPRPHSPRTADGVDQSTAAAHDPAMAGLGARRLRPGELTARICERRPAKFSTGSRPVAVLLMCMLPYPATAA
ncbi:unnamed protein product, partial [Urochloa humidicola]